MTGSGSPDSQMHTDDHNHPQPSSSSRNTVTSRLHSLFASQQGSQQDMRPPRAGGAAAGPRASSGSRPHSRPQSLVLSTAGPSQTHTEGSARPHPVLRWMSGRHASKSLSSSPIPSPIHSSPIGTPPTSGATTPSSAVSALADALHDNPLLSSAHSGWGKSSSSLVPLPTRPEAARLPAHFRATRPPRYLSELTRSTLPSASLSPPLPYDDEAFENSLRHTDPFSPDPHDEDRERDLDILYSPTPMPLAIPHSPAPAHLGRQRSATMSTSSTQSSLDTLRSIHDRTIHTAAPAQFKVSLLPDSVKSWFGGDESGDGKAMHQMLNEEDQRPTRQAERDHIRQKCKFRTSVLQALAYTTVQTLVLRTLWSSVMACLVSTLLQWDYLSRLCKSPIGVA